MHGEAVRGRRLLQIVSEDNAADHFCRWRELPAFAAIEAHPLTGAFSRSYYPRVFEGQRQRASFAVVADGQPLLIALVTVGPGVIDYFGQPVSLFIAPDADADQVLESALQHLSDIAGGSAELAIREDGAAGERPALSRVCAARGLRAQLRYSGVCDLTAGEAGVRSGLRHSFRSLVNWGRTNLRMSYVNRDTPDRTAFDTYRGFHREVAGRDTRAAASWDAMFAWIASGWGELSLGRLPTGELVAGTMVVDGATTSYYASGVYDRTRFDKPLGHWPVHNAMLRSALRGRMRFDLGEIPVEGTVSPKEFAIGKFKKGFVRDVTPWTKWTADGEPRCRARCIAHVATE